jgi:hypothetical protein
MRIVIGQKTGENSDLGSINRNGNSLTAEYCADPVRWFKPSHRAEILALIVRAFKPCS